MQIYLFIYFFTLSKHSHLITGQQLQLRDPLISWFSSNYHSDVVVCSTPKTSLNELSLDVLVVVLVVA